VGSASGELPFTIRDREVGASDLTRGLVKGVGQNLTSGSATYHNLIRTDAVANLANFGGPMVNGAGELLGMVMLSEAGYAFGIPVADLDSLARNWTKSENAIRLGPPLVKGPSSARVMSSGFPPGFGVVTSENWSYAGYHVSYKKAEDYDYGSEHIDIYIDVKDTVDDAKFAYKGRLDAVLSYGYTKVGSSGDLGDEVTLFQGVSKIAYAVLWRDRNAWVLLYLTSGAPPRPEVTLGTTLDLASQQARLLEDGLASYE
jgi:hypothetical protein